jgi:hypothetical protein
MALPSKAKTETPQKPTIVQTEEVNESEYVEAVKDAITLITGLEKYCSSFEELHGLLTHAIENPAQLRLLMKQISE